MDPNLYNAAMEGKVDVLEQYSAEQLEGQLTPNKNTILHVAAQFGQVQFVEAILEKCPILLRHVNSKDETALHFAAREGYSEIAKALIERAKKGDVESGSIGVVAKEMLLRAINYEDRDTALHMAVRNDHLQMVRLLTTEDPEFTHQANKAEETPLYLAAEGGLRNVSVYPVQVPYAAAVFAILDNCASPAYSGPGGRTALHAAALFDFNGRIIERLLDWKKDVIKETDAHGWTPLHCAARADNEGGVRRLLEREKAVAYITADKDEGKTALHTAAAKGYTSVMTEILLHCPDCWEVVNSKGQNVLHIALEMESRRSAKFILEQPWSRHLINQKDNKGHTPVHLIAEFGRKPFWDILTKIQFNKKGPNWCVFNDKNMSPSDVQLLADLEEDVFRLFLDIGSGRNIVTAIDHPDNITKWKTASKERHAKDREAKKAQAERFKKVGDTHLIVATLIATVTFAASFTMPGGYNSNIGHAEQGTPLLLEVAAFKAFVVTNTIALISSTSSVFLYMTAALYGFRDDHGELYKQVNRYLSASILNLIAMAAMVIAFITGSYSMLSHGKAVAVSVCIIACFSFFIYFLEIKKFITFLKNL